MGAAMRPALPCARSLSLPPPAVRLLVQHARKPHHRGLPQPPLGDLLPPLALLLPPLPVLAKLLPAHMLAHARAAGGSNDKCVIVRNIRLPTMASSHRRAFAVAPLYRPLDFLVVPLPYRRRARSRVENGKGAGAHVLKRSKRSFRLWLAWSSIIGMYSKHECDIQMSSFCQLRNPKLVGTHIGRESGEVLGYLFNLHRSRPLGL